MSVWETLIERVFQSKQMHEGPVWLRESGNLGKSVLGLYRHAGTAVVAQHSRAPGKVLSGGPGAHPPHPHDAHLPQPASALSECTPSFNMMLPCSHLLTLMGTVIRLMQSHEASENTCRSGWACLFNVASEAGGYSIVTEDVLSPQAARETRRSASTDVLTGIAVNGSSSSAASWDDRHTSRMETVARQMASGLGSYALSGRVGDCCDEEEVCTSVFSIPALS